MPETFEIVTTKGDSSPGARVVKSRPAWLLATNPPLRSKAETTAETFDARHAEARVPDQPGDGQCASLARVLHRDELEHRVLRAGRCRRCGVIAVGHRHHHQERDGQRGKDAHPDERPPLHRRIGAGREHRRRRDVPVCRRGFCRERGAGGSDPSIAADNAATRAADRRASSVRERHALMPNAAAAATDAHVRTISTESMVPYRSVNSTATSTITSTGVPRSVDGANRHCRTALTAR